MNLKIEKYFTTYRITTGFFVAFLGSLFIYMQWFEIPSRSIETISALMFFWLLLSASRVIWFWSGFFISFLWFWWIVVSFKHYGMLWAIPIGILLISLIYGFIFWFISYASEKISLLAPQHSSITILTIRSISIVLLGYLHPLSFDWYKPELVFVHSYIGVSKWHLAIVLIAISLAQYKKNILYLLFVLLAYSPYKTEVSPMHVNSTIALCNTMTTVEDKWNQKLVVKHIKEVFDKIDKAIVDKKKMIILPESVFPFFLNKESKIFDKLKEKSKSITIVIGALYLDGKVHRNSTYVIHDSEYKIANKVILVPFGESNPLPKWASKWVNRVFFDGAIDYEASSKPTDFKINGIVYRNAICYEATSDKLYSDNPKNMIAISNNGWFTPSIEPTLQRLLLEFYSRKYGTTIYHSTNMSPSYFVKRVL